MAPISPRAGTRAWSRLYRLIGEGNRQLAMRTLLLCSVGELGQQASPYSTPQGFELGGALVRQRLLRAERGQAIKCLLGALEGRSRLRVSSLVTSNLTQGQPGFSRDPVIKIDPLDRGFELVGSDREIGDILFAVGHGIGGLLNQRHGSLGTGVIAAAAKLGGPSNLDPASANDPVDQLVAVLAVATSPRCVDQFGQKEMGRLEIAQQRLDDCRLGANCFRFGVDFQS